MAALMYWMDIHLIRKRILYTRPLGTQDPYSLAIGNSLSQESGSRIFQGLNDYIYTAGGDLTYNL